MADAIRVPLAKDLAAGGAPGGQSFLSDESNLAGKLADVGLRLKKENATRFVDARRAALSFLNRLLPKGNCS